MALKVLGIDPGIAMTGYGIVQHKLQSFTSVVFGVIHTTPKQPVQKRLEVVYNYVSELVKTHNPRVLAIEKVFFNRNVSSALSVGQARGVVLLVAAEHGLEVFEYTPQYVKAAVTGYGKADKEQVGRMVRLLLSLPETPKPADATDALALALSHRAS